MEFNELFDINLIDSATNNLTSKKEAIDLVELISLLSSFDSYKLELVTKKEVLKKLSKYIESRNCFLTDEKTKQNTQIIKNNDMDSIQLFLGLINLSLNLVVDKKQEMVEQYKKNYDITDEEVKSWENLQSQYNKDVYDDHMENLKYHQDAIKKYGVYKFVTRDVKISNFIANLFENYGTSISLKTEVISLIFLFNLLFRDIA